MPAWYRPAVVIVPPVAVQVAEVSGGVELSDILLVAVNCCVPLLKRPTESGVMFTETMVSGGTTICVLAVLVSLVAVTVAEPVARAVTRPDTLVEATPEAELFQ